MLRFIVPSLTLLLALPFAAQAASLKDTELNQMLQQVAKQSSEGTPRAINEDILDQGFTVEGKELIDHLSVRPEQAEKMRADKNTVRYQLGVSVCQNQGFRDLLTRGAVMRYDFTEYKTNKFIGTQRYTAADCDIKTDKAPATKKK
ncbi:MAG: PA3611 family quorum-sensing-regulated virulence factor [Janthinobacterium lividum]|jgi:hypothetical protein|uniref:PA3611 family quorum-sensing-regulated virulence factor n=1 Tax=Pseudomonas baltica TaxID=2762576 RepID=UPI0028A17283|nr:PA3611 family quorum-sensing-regulated virulence factor [Pseudomonas baltica]